MLFQYLQGRQGGVLTPREATEAPRQRFRSPLSPTESTESATVQSPLFCIALLSKITDSYLNLATLQSAIFSLTLAP